MNNNKTKKSQFKNPFDLDIDEEGQQQAPIIRSVKQTEQPNIINPLPFNPYVIEKQTQNSQKLQKSLSSQTEAFQPSPSIKPFRPTQIKPTIVKDNQRQIPDRRPEPKAEKVYELNEDGDIPLLQDIGIEPQMIRKRAVMILKMQKPDQQIIQQPDLSGPILIALCFGFLLLLSGKIQFGDIYAIFVFGNLLLFFLFNFMSQIELIPLYSIMSTLGYAMIPMLLLGLISIFASMKGTAGIIFSLCLAAWSSLAASNFIQALMKQTQSNRKLLLIYPLFLFYVCFAMIVIV